MPQRAYKIVYKTRTPNSREADYTHVTPSRQNSDFDYEVRSPTSSKSHTLPSARPRSPERVSYAREDGIVVVERTPGRYAAAPEPSSHHHYREPKNGFHTKPPGLVKARTMPMFASDYSPGSHHGHPAGVVETRTSRHISSGRHFSSDDNSDSDEDKPRGRRGRPSQAVDRSPPQRLRSCMRGSRDDSPDRARGRSVSFRDAEAAKHDVGEKFHEKPGEEARKMGKFLRDYRDDDDLASVTYAERRGAERRYWDE